MERIASNQKQPPDVRRCPAAKEYNHHYDEHFDNPLFSHRTLLGMSGSETGILNAHGGIRSTMSKVRMGYVFVRLTKRQLVRQLVPE